MKKMNFTIGAMIVALSALTASPLLAQNNFPGGPAGMPQPDEPGDIGENYSINIKTGNENRKIEDLKVWGGVGEHALTWTRFSNSRSVNGAQLFGNGHWWKHAYQYELLSTSADSSGRARLIFTMPEGNTFTFTQLDPVTWTTSKSAKYVLLGQGEDLLMKNKEKAEYFFKKITDATGTYYLMTEFYDNQGNTYLLSYDDKRNVTSIREPAGRSLNVTYSTLTSNAVDFKKLGEITAAPAPSTWVEIPFTSNKTYRYVKLNGADGSYGNIAEAEFYDDQGNKLSGSVISSDSIAQAGLAFDGDANTGFISTSQSGSFVGLDLGTAKKISKVRFLAVAGQEALMKPTQTNYTPVRAEAANEAPLSLTVISQVSSSDGRSVDYLYSPYNDTIFPNVFQTLSEVHYGDGTQATYTYGQVFPGQRPLVTIWNDVRYALRQGRSKTVYRNDTASTILGYVDSQVNPDTNAVILKLGDPASDVKTVTFSNGAVYESKIENGKEIEKTDPLGNKTTYQYDSNGFLAQEIDPLGRTTQYVRNSVGQLMQTIDPDGSSVSYTRNAIGQLLTYTDRLGRVTTYTRDAQERVTRIDYPDASFETFTYNAFSKVIQKRLKNGGIENYSYDLGGLMTQKTDALGNVTHYGYDSADRIASVTDARGNTTITEYNERGLVTKATNADGTFSSYGYDSMGSLQTTTNELGYVSTMKYDIFKRLTSKTDPLGRTTNFSYGVIAGGCSSCHADEKPTEIILPSGKKVVIEYDLMWRETALIEAAGTSDAATTRTTLDAVGNPIAVTNALGKVAMYSYDARNRKVAQVDPLGNRTEWSYDFEGNNLTITDALSRVTSNSFDSMNRMVSTTDAKNQTTSYQYDFSGNMIRMTDAKGNSYQNTFDLLNRKTAMIYPDNSREIYGFDSVGNNVSYTPRAGQVRTCSYDNRNRQLTCDWSDSTPDVSRTFDALGRLLTSNNSVSAISYTYNAANEMLTETTVVGGQSRTLTYAYTIDGNRASVTYPGGNVVTYDYTNRNQVAAIYEDGGAPLATYGYDLNGSRISKTLENGTSTAYQFDDASRLTSITDKKGSTTLLSSVYTLNAVGNRTAKVQDLKSETYGFDAIDQVTGVDSNGSRNVAYNYDAVGNRTSVIDNGATTSYTTNNLNQYTSAFGSGVGYDGNGNLTAQQSNGLSALYFYDAQNRLTKATVGTNVTEFWYDSKNRVVKRKTNSGTTYLVYDSWSLIEERANNGTIKARYVHGTQIDEILARITPTKAVYYHHDGLGSTTLLTNINGKVVEKYSYDVFGKASIYGATSQQLLASSSYGNRFMFTGREFLQEVNLYDYRNRVYSQELGRFLQTDPIRFSAGDMNLYRYCGNNVVDKADPLGLFDICININFGFGGDPTPPEPDPKPDPKPEPPNNQPPPSPPGVNIFANMNEAKKHGIYWFYTQVRNKGPWDYKQKGRQYQDFGNFNYGATGRAAGFSLETLLRAAGAAQIKAGTSKKEWGTPSGGPPYGDDPADQELIRRGYEYAEYYGY